MNGRVLVLGPCAQAQILGDLTGVEVLRGPLAKEAVGLVRDLHPDLVLIDSGEDHETAVALVEPIVQIGSGLLRRTVLLMDGPPQAVIQALGDGAADVLPRSIADDELLVRVQVALRTQRHLEAELTERQRTTLQELAGAVAHRINQPLTSMSVIVETLIAQHSRGDLSAERLRGRLSELQSLVERTASIVKQIGSLVDYKTVPYVGAVRIIDLGPESLKKRGSSSS